MARPSAKHPHTTVIVSLAILLRLAVVWGVARTHSAPWFFGQATELARLAESLHSGHGLSSPFGGNTGPSAFLSPGYPAIVATVFTAFHPYSYASALALMCLQACFGAATVFLLMRLTSRAFGSSAANLAGAIWAVAPPLLWLPTLFWETSLSILLATAIPSLALDCAERPTRRAWLGAGLLGACALAINPSLLPILACCFGWALYRTRSQPLSAPLLGFILCLLLLVPWGIRNYHQLHAFIPLRDNFGYELWQGNRLGSNGFFTPDLHPTTNIHQYTCYQSLGEVAYMQEKGSIAMDTINANPSHFAALTSKRILYFWTGLARTSSPLVVAYISLTTILGISGLFMVYRHNKDLVTFFLFTLLLFPLPYYITHPDFRFRLVLDPLMTALAACALTRSTAAKQQASGAASTTRSVAHPRVQPHIPQSVPRQVPPRFAASHGLK